MRTSEKYSSDQINFLHAICCKILDDHKQAVRLYKKLGHAIQVQYNLKVKKDTFGVILCSLQASRKFTEDRINQFNNLIELLDPNDGFDR